LWQSIKILKPNVKSEIKKTESMVVGRNLTPRQLLIWTGEKLAPTIPASNMVMRFDLTGKLDCQRFADAFAEVVAITDILRTTINETASGNPEQIINSRMDEALQPVDVSQHVNPEQAKDAWVAQDAVKAFDLTRCGYRTALIKYGDEQHHWYLCQHHVITDGWSAQIIFDRVKAIYENGAESQTPPGANSYNTYLDYVDKYSKSNPYLRAENYWKEKLAEALEPLRLYSRSRDFSSRTERVSVHLDSEHTKALKRVAKEVVALNGDMGIFVLFSTLIFASLHLASGNKCIGLGAPVHNRSRKFNKICGMMMEVCPLVVEFDERETFASLMEKVRDDAFSTIANAQYTTKNPAHSRIYDVSLNFLNPAFGDIGEAKTLARYQTGLHFMPEPRVSENADTQSKKNKWAAGESLAVVVNDFGDSDRYIVDLDFNTGIFDPQLREKMAGHFSKLVEAFIVDPNMPIDSVDLLSEPERRYLLEEINQTQVDTPHESVIEALERHASQTPACIAVVYGASELTYLELNKRVNVLSQHLTSLGVGPEVSVGIFMERSQELLVALLAVMKSGGAYVPFDPHHPADRIELILEDAKPRVLISDSATVSALKVDETTMVLSLKELWAEELPLQNPQRQLQPSRLAYTIFTSGSTGRPKGVQISHAALNNFLHSMARKPGLTCDDRLLSVTTISFDIAALEMYLPILMGGQVDIADQETTIDPARLRAHLEHATVLQATPATYRMLLEDGWKGDKKLTVLCGGEPFPRDLADQLVATTKSVWNMYGPTETTIWSTIDQVGPENIVPIGHPIDNTQVYVLSPSNLPVPQGCIGELYIAGDGLARGYHERPDLTEKVFVDNPFIENTLMYRTGDLARFLMDGRLECMGRVDFQVKLRGFRIELGEIETLLGQQTEVNQNVLVVSGEGDDKKLIAYVSLLAPVDAAELRERLREKLPAYMVPAVVVILDKLPLTANGKIDRKQLPEPEQTDFSVSSQVVAPKTPTEIKIAHIWQEALKLENISIKDSFFDIGGHSLVAVKIMNAINAACEVDLSLGVIFETPTIEEIAKRVEQPEDGRDSSVITLKAGSKQPLFCICGIHMYQDLANNIHTDNPVYGVFLQQETEIWQRDNTKALPTVKELAALYLEAVQNVQPQGPYNLTGVSFGGVLAYEMSQQLIATGQEVNMLALLDTVLPSAIKKRTSLMLKHHFDRLRSRGTGHIKHVLFRRLGRLPVVGRIARKKLRIISQLQGVVHDDVMDFRRKSYSNAMRLYGKVIKPYSGRALMFCAVDRNDALIGCDVKDCGGWSELVDKLTLIDVEGDHVGIMKTPNVVTIAQALEARINSES
jgi:amino acid adenylation domain-containing protein